MKKTEPGDSQEVNLPPPYREALRYIAQDSASGHAIPDTITDDLLGDLIDDFEIVPQNEIGYALYILEEAITLTLRHDATAAGIAVIAAHNDIPAFRDKAPVLLFDCAQRQAVTDTEKALILCIAAITQLEAGCPAEQMAQHQLQFMAIRNALLTGNSRDTRSLLHAGLSNNISEERYKSIMSACQDGLHQFCPPVPRRPLLPGYMP